MNTEKTNMLRNLLLFGLFILAVMPIYSQQQRNCPSTLKDIQKLYPGIPFLDFDYRGQSSNAYLQQGDTVDYDVVLYAYKDYRIMVCGEEQLGNVKFAIYQKTKEPIRQVKQINTIEPQTVYKVDENGEMMYDDNYQPIVDKEKTTTVVTYDTVWENKFNKKEVLVFENKTKNFWDIKSVEKTTNYVIRVMIPYTTNLPEGADIYDISGCVNILVGHKPQAKSKTFQKM